MCRIRMAESNSQDPLPDYIQSQSYTNQYQYTGQQNFQPYQQFPLVQNYAPTEPTYRGRHPRSRPISRRGRGGYAPNFSQPVARGNFVFQPPRQAVDPSPPFQPHYGHYNQMPPMQFFTRGQPWVVGARGHGFQPRQGPLRGQDRGQPKHRYTYSQCFGLTAKSCCNQS